MKQSLKNSDEKYLKALGAEIRRIILYDLKYSSLDRFALKHYNKITKPTLYAICDGKRDFQFSTISGLSQALNINPITLLKKVKYSTDQKAQKRRLIII